MSLLARTFSKASLFNAMQCRNMATGTVKTFNQSKGFGFIRMDEGEEDVFVHYTGIKTTGFRFLEQGERVSFDLEVQEDDRKKAVNVTGESGPLVREHRDQF